jgi:hypothetical protein
VHGCQGLGGAQGAGGVKRFVGFAASGGERFLMSMSGAATIQSFGHETMHYTQQYPFFCAYYGLMK